MRWRLLGVLSLALLCCGACNSILGDFGVATGPGADSGVETSAQDAAPDGNPGDAARDAPDGSTRDGGDAGAPLGTLACGPPSAPVALDNRNGQNPSSYTNVTAYSAGPNTTRIVGALDAAQIFTVYSVDTSGAAPVTTSATLNSNGGSVVGTMRVTGGFGVVVQMPNGATASSLSLYVFPDADPVTPLPTPVPLATIGGTTPSSIIAAVVELAPGTYYVAFASKDTSGSLYELFVGIATGGVAANVTAVDTNANNDYQLPSAVAAGSTVYLYVGSHLGSAAFYALPNTGTTTGVTRTPVAPITSGISAFGGILDGVAGSRSGTTNLAYLEEDANDAGTGLGALVYRAFAVPNAKLPALAASDISFGKSYTDPALAPFSPFVRLFGDDFVAVGTGLTSAGDPTAWVNFLWLNTTGVMRGERSGAVQGLFSGRGTFIRRMTAAPGAVTATAATWNIAFSQYDPAASNSDTLYFASMECH